MTGVLLISMTALLSPAASDESLLRDAQERIQAVRRGEATLKPTIDGKALPAGTQMSVNQKQHAFLFGAHIFVLGKYDTPAQNAAFEKQFAGLLNYATLPFYWWDYESQAGVTKDERTAFIVKWCREHQVLPKGHPLAWNYVDPKWLPDDPEAVLKLQLDRIEKTVRQWAGQIDVWDVVNEATVFDRADCKKNAPLLTAAIAKVGVPTYLKRAFEAARRGNPKATLIINDYVTSPDYATKVIDQLNDADGRPLYDVIGIQCHQHGGAWTAQQTWEICERFARYGKPLHFTEATLLSGEHGWEKTATRPAYQWSSTPEGEARQAREVVRFYTMLFSHPSVRAITWWDPSDQHAWQAAPSGLMRRDLTPKPAYEELRRLVKGAWWTKTAVLTEADGTAKMRGFYGTYEVRVTLGDRTLTGTFAFDQTTRGPIEVSLTAPKAPAA